MDTTKTPTVQRYTLRDDAGSEEEIEAGSLSEARNAARNWVRGGDWNAPTSTIWVDVRIDDEDGDAVDRITVSVDPAEPKCEDHEDHEWKEIGLQGHGGGVVYRERCAHGCGWERVIDTWAQRPDTGEEGLRSIAYDRGVDDD
jgi:hypothetical protein